MYDEICRNFGHVWDLSEDEVNVCLHCGELDFDPYGIKEKEKEMSSESGDVNEHRWLTIDNNYKWIIGSCVDNTVLPTEPKDRKNIPMCTVDDINYCVNWRAHQWVYDYIHDGEVCAICNLYRTKEQIRDEMYKVPEKEEEAIIREAIFRDFSLLNFADDEITNTLQGTLPQDAKERKNIPMCTGVLDYFPDALAEIAIVSKAGNDQHNPGQPLHWAKEKSTDHADCIVRHLTERGTRDTDGMRHTAKVAWRALALLQTEIENEKEGN